ncbi:MAG: hypothetical protein VX278_01070, partial [Myxococcota bacterium]|nr:hypothetical protein [Myxococcota bacterium]
KAISLDLVPDSTPEINDIIRKVARRNRVPLLDFRKKTWEAARHRGQFFRDPVHVNPTGAYQMAAWTKESIAQNFPQLVQE